MGQSIANTQQTPHSYQTVKNIRVDWDVSGQVYGYPFLSSPKKLGPDYHVFFTDIKFGGVLNPVKQFYISPLFGFGFGTMQLSKEGVFPSPIGNLQSLSLSAPMGWGEQNIWEVGPAICYQQFGTNFEEGFSFAGQSDEVVQISKKDSFVVLQMHGQLQVPISFDWKLRPHLAASAGLAVYFDSEQDEELSVHFGKQFSMSAGLTKFF